MPELTLYCGYCSCIFLPIFIILYIMVICTLEWLHESIFMPYLVFVGIT